jgi:lipoate-protein ligase A
MRRYGSDPKRPDEYVSVDHVEALTDEALIDDDVCRREARRGGGAGRVRLIVDEPSDGPWNMAVDEVLLEDMINTDDVCLRLYRWSEPTLSLGYFQAYHERHSHAASAHCPAVRRASGGGAIVHDRELTYSLAVSARHPLGQRSSELYTRVHDTLVRALDELGVQTRPHGAVCASVASTGSLVDNEAATPRPFLCFQRRSPVDLVQGDRKIVGSAQRRRRGAVLQQGSVILAASEAAAEVPGPVYAGAPLSTGALINAWLRKLAHEFDWTAEPVMLSDRQRRRAEELVRAKYGREAWTRRR